MTTPTPPDPIPDGELLAMTERAKAFQAFMVGEKYYFVANAFDDLPRVVARLRWVEAENERLRLRVLSAAGDDLCRLTQEEIKELSAGTVKIPPKAEFLASCERFHSQLANESGELSGCLTLAQMIAENERLLAELRRLQTPTPFNTDAESGNVDLPAND